MRPSPSLRAVWAVAAAAAVLRALVFGGLELYNDEAYYWLWSLRPALGYFDHPPLVAWLIRLSSALAPGEAVLRAPFFACGGLAVLFAGLTAREISDDPRAPAWAALLAATAPLLTLTGVLAVPDAPVEAAYGAGTWLLGRARGRGWLVAGVAVGLALLSKYSAALLAPSLLLLVWWDRELRQELRSPWPWLGALVSVAIFAPCLLWNAAHDWVSIRFQLWHGFRSGASLRGFLEYLGAQLGGLGPAALPLGVAFLARARSSPVRRVAAATLLPLLVTTYSAIKGPAEGNWAVLVYPGLCAGAAAQLVRLRPALGRGLLLGSLALGVVAAAVYAAEVRSPRLFDPTNAAVERFRGRVEFGRKAVAAAARACAEVENRPGCLPGDPYVFPSTYQYAAQLAYYAGWRRFGPAQGRPSQLDLWNDVPPEGSAFLYVGPEGPPPPESRLFQGEGQGQTVAFDIRLRGEVIRTGGVTPFARFRGLRARPPRE